MHHSPPGRRRVIGTIGAAQVGTRQCRGAGGTGELVNPAAIWRMINLR